MRYTAAASGVVDFSLHILLIDDDTELSSLLGEFLQREGYSVESEHEGNRGLLKALQPGVELEVLDVMLPGIDGFEILRRLRAERSEHGKYLKAHFRDGITGSRNDGRTL